MAGEQQQVTTDAPAAEGAQAADEAVSHEELLERLSARARDPSVDWREALVETIAQWPLAEESVGRRRYVYLVGGEAFDWRSLAERLMDACSGAAPVEEQEELLTGFGLPADMSDDEWKRVLGVDKYRAHLNYVYGVTVEQALQVAVQEEICKRHLGNGYQPTEAHCVQAYSRLYGKPLEELWAEFQDEAPGSLRSGAGADVNALADGPVSPCAADGDAFTYWLFKRRVARADPARVASDTRKGLRQLESMRRSHERRLKLLR